VAQLLVVLQQHHEIIRYFGFCKAFALFLGTARQAA